MNMRILKFCTITGFVFFSLVINAQRGKYLQIDLGGGLSMPVADFKTEQMFAARGYSASAGFDYFFGRLGLGFSGGYFNNPAKDAFSSFIIKKYLEDVNFANMQQWTTGYATLGPTLKLGGNRISMDIFAKAGYCHINIPQLQFNKTFFNQSYEVYKFSGTSKDWQFGWNAGTRLICNINPWIGLQARADFFTTRFMSEVAYNNTFREAVDGNRNGIMEDSEYFESQKMSASSTTDLSVVNVNMGLVFYLGKKKAVPVTQMVPDMADSHEKKEDMVKSDPVSKEPEITAPETKPDLPVEKQQTEQSATDDNIPVANLNEAPKPVTEPEVKEKAPEANVLDETKKEMAGNQQNQGKVIPTELPVTTYDAPEAKYDEQAAEHLYIAGEAYFADNDFENAIPLFNKLKADPKYPRARYMFALSLCSTGNCDEAKKEYREFARSYKGDDARTLEIIFASHFEKCAMTRKAENAGQKSEGKVSVRPASQTDVQTKDSGAVVVSPTPAAQPGTEYKVQFIALRKSDKQFPRVADMGLIGTEFFKDRTLYRYSLAGYSDLDTAIQDVIRVRKLGFRDAFIAVYKNGVRVNTLYHAR